MFVDSKCDKKHSDSSSSSSSSSDSSSSSGGSCSFDFSSSSESSSSSSCFAGCDSSSDSSSSSLFGSCGDSSSSSSSSSSSDSSSDSSSAETLMVVEKKEGDENTYVKVDYHKDSLVYEKDDVVIINNNTPKQGSYIVYEAHKKVKTIFCLPTTGDIHIILPHNIDLGSQILIKDASNEASDKLDRNYNVKIFVNGYLIENRQFSLGVARNFVVNDKYYIIDSNGGAVTFVFFSNHLLCETGHWLIANEFVGTWSSAGRSVRNGDGSERKVGIIRPLIEYK